MLKTIIAANLMILAGMNYLKPANETYKTLNGFYTITLAETPTESLQLFDNDFGTSRIIKYNPLTLIPTAIAPNDYASAYLNVNSLNNKQLQIVITPNDSQIPQFITTTDLNTNEYNYIYFENIKIKADRTDFIFVKQNDISGGAIVNKTYNLKNFNPVGFLNHNYSENFLIPSAITTPIDILGEYHAIYKGHIVSEMKSTWINAQASYIQTNNASRPIALITDDNYKLYMYTTIKYYDEDISNYKTEYISNAVYDNRVNTDSQVVGTYLTNKLNNIDEKLYVMGLESEQDRVPDNPLDTFFKYYDIESGINIGIDGNIGDVFSLLAQCFMGIGGFFGIALIPGITLGALFFLPFIVSLIIWLINLFKRH